MEPCPCCMCFRVSICIFKAHVFTCPCAICFDPPYTPLVSPTPAPGAKENDRRVMDGGDGGKNLGQALAAGSAVDNLPAFFLSQAVQCSPFAPVPFCTMAVDCPPGQGLNQKASCLGTKAGQLNGSITVSHCQSMSYRKRELSSSSQFSLINLFIYLPHLSIALSLQTVFILLQGKSHTTFYILISPSRVPPYDIGKCNCCLFRVVPVLACS